MHLDIISLEGLHKARGHAAGLRAHRGGEAGDEVQSGSKLQRLSGRVSAAVVGQELNGIERSIGIKACLGNSPLS